MVDLHCELVAAFRLNRYGHERAAVGGCRDKIKQIHSGRVHTLERNNVVASVRNVGENSWAQEMTARVISTCVGYRIGVRGRQRYSREALNRRRTPRALL